MELILTICEDLKEPVGYIPHGIMISLVFLAVYGIWARYKRAGKVLRITERGRLVYWCLAVVYFVVMLETAFFSREPHSRIGVNMKFLGTWGESVVSRGYVIENVLMFIPFGILLPGCFRFFKNGIFCILVACFGSIAIEYAQYVTQRGFCQLDDVVMNTIGAALGWGIFWLRLHFFTRLNCYE